MDRKSYKKSLLTSFKYDGLMQWKIWAKNINKLFNNWLNSNLSRFKDSCQKLFIDDPEFLKGI